MLVAALLQQETNKTLSMSSMLANCKKIYQYLQLRKVNTIITLEP
jgi:hypothetical protein